MRYKRRARNTVGQFKGVLLLNEFSPRVNQFSCHIQGPIRRRSRTPYIVSIENGKMCLDTTFPCVSPYRTIDFSLFVTCACVSIAATPIATRLVTSFHLTFTKKKKYIQKFLIRSRRVCRVCVYVNRVYSGSHSCLSCTNYTHLLLLFVSK